MTAFLICLTSPIDQPPFRIAQPRDHKPERAEGMALNDKLPWKERDHALFTGFAPVGAPRYAVAVVVEHGGSGAHAAAPIARDILIECQKRKLA